jgi:hypothetical protein
MIRWRGAAFGPSDQRRAGSLAFVSLKVPGSRPGSVDPTRLRHGRECRYLWRSLQLGVAFNVWVTQLNTPLTLMDLDGISPPRRAWPPDRS